jgi:hypothetical protein
MWWQDLLWGFWNGLTLWIVFIAHVFNAWENKHLYDALKNSDWYDFGFLIGAGTPFFGFFGKRG